MLLFTESFLGDGTKSEMMLWDVLFAGSVPTYTIILWVILGEQGKLY